MSNILRGDDHITNTAAQIQLFKMLDSKVPNFGHFPLIKSKDGLLEIIKEINKSKVCPFLTVLKQFGKQQSKFSFPMEGLTIALDFPVNPETLKLLEKLDEITLKYKGRVYLAKDSRMKKEIFQKTDTRIKDYLNFRNKNNSKSYFSSSQSTRLGL